MRDGTTMPDSGYIFAPVGGKFCNSLRDIQARAGRA
jgi:hypothetical protein